MRLKIFICVVLGIITLQIYSPVEHFGIVYYDDPAFVGAPAVMSGDLGQGLAWVATGAVVANWHPVTNFTYWFVHQIYGVNPGAEHSLNILIHGCNAMLLFLVLVAMTRTLTSPLPSPQCSDFPLKPSPGLRPPSPAPAGEGKPSSSPLEHQSLKSGAGGMTVSRENIWLCAFVAAIFAWHPLRVESVAWISERKDVLFLFFMLLALLCYAWYAQPRPEIPATKRQQLAFEFPPSRRVCYNLALLFFLLSLLSKAMAVTFPFLLLLLDYWPLKRLEAHRRLQIADWKMPNKSSPHPEREQLSDPGCHQQNRWTATVIPLIVEKIPFFALTVVFCVVTFWIQKKYAAVWTLGQIGMIARLENATLSYVNYLGNFFWPSKLAVIYPYPQNFDIGQVLLAGLLLLAISAFCVLQLRRRPYLAVGWFWYLGTMVPVIGLVRVGDQAMADRYTYLPLIGPAISLIWLAGEWVGTKLLRKTMATASAVVLLGACIILTRKQVWFWQDSVKLFEHTIAVTQPDAFTEFSLGKGLEMEGRLKEAAVHYQIAAALKPGDFNSNLNYAALLLQLGYYREAIARFESVLKLHPDAPLAMNNVAWMLATCPDARVQDRPRAVKLAERACELTQYQNPTFVTTLAMAYGEAGQFDEGISTTQKAIALAQQEGDMDLVSKNQRLLELYQAHQPYMP